MKKTTYLIGLLTLSTVLGTSAQTSLYTTADDFAQFDNSTSVVSSVNYSLSSTMNGVGNTSSSGGTGGVGSLQLTTAGGWNSWMSGSQFPGMTAAAFSAFAPGSSRPWSPESGYGAGSMVACSGIVTFDLYAGNLSSWYQFGISLNYDGHNGVTFFSDSTTTFTGADGNTWLHVEVPYTTGATALSYFGMAFSENSDSSVNADKIIYMDNFQVTAAPVPEPGTMALAAMGGAALLFLRRRTVR